MRLWSYKGTAQTKIVRCKKDEMRIYMSFIPVNEPLLNGNEKKYLCECIDTGWISSEGPFVR